MERLVRAHPSNILVSYINEPFPDGRRRPAAQPDPRRNDALVRGGRHRSFTWPIPIGSPRPSTAITIRPGPGLPDNHCYSGWYNGHGVELGALHKGLLAARQAGLGLRLRRVRRRGARSAWSLMRKCYPKSWLPQNAGRGEALDARPDPRRANRPHALLLLRDAAHACPVGGTEPSAPGLGHALDDRGLPPRPTDAKLRHPPVHRRFSRRLDEGHRGLRPAAQAGLVRLPRRT